MPASVSWPARARRTLAEQAERLRQSLESLGQQLRESNAGEIARAVAAAVCEAVRAATARAISPAMLSRSRSPRESSEARSRSACSASARPARAGQVTEAGMACPSSRCSSGRQGFSYSSWRRDATAA